MPGRPNIPLQASPSNRMGGVMGGAMVHSSSRDVLRMKRLAEVAKAKSQQGKVYV